MARPAAPARLKEAAGATAPFYGRERLSDQERQRLEDKTTVVIVQNPGSFWERKLTDLRGLESLAVLEARRALAALYPEQAKEKNVVVLNGSEIMMVSGATVTEDGQITMALGEKRTKRWKGLRRDIVTETPGKAHIAKVVLSDHQAGAYIEPHDIKYSTVPQPWQRGGRLHTTPEKFGDVIAETMKHGITVSYDKRVVPAGDEKGSKPQDLYVLQVGKSEGARAQIDEKKLTLTVNALQIEGNGRLGTPATLVTGQTDYIEIGEGHDAAKFRFTNVTLENQITGIRNETITRVGPIPVAGSSVRAKLAGAAAARTRTAAIARGDGDHRTQPDRRDLTAQSRVEEAAAPVTETPYHVLTTEAMQGFLSSLTLRQLAQILQDASIETRGVTIEVPRRQNRLAVAETGTVANEIKLAYHNQQVRSLSIEHGTADVAKLIEEADPTNLVHALEHEGTRRSVKKSEEVHNVTSANARLLDIRREIAVVLQGSRGERTANEVARDYLSTQYRGGNAELIGALADQLAAKTPAERAYDVLQRLGRVDGKGGGMSVDEAISAVAELTHVRPETAERLVRGILAETQGSRRTRSRRGSDRGRETRGTDHYSLDTARVLLTVDDPMQARGYRLMDETQAMRYLLSKGFPAGEAERAIAQLYGEQVAPKDLIETYGRRPQPGRRRGYEDEGY